jgi:hypothetical protein
VALLPAETKYFGEREPFYADVGKAFPHLVQTPLPYYGIDPFHLGSFPDAACSRLGTDLTWMDVKSA